MMPNGDHKTDFLSHLHTNNGWEAQWLSGRVLKFRPRGSGFELTGVIVLCP